MYDEYLYSSKLNLALCLNKNCHVTISGIPKLFRIDTVVETNFALIDKSVSKLKLNKNDSYCIFYLKQYLLEGDELQYISFKKDKFYKSNKNNDKEIRALAQFSNGVIVQGITGEYNGKDSGDLFFYY